MVCNLVVGYPFAHISNLIILIPFAQPIATTAATTGVWSWETQLSIFGIGVFYTVWSIGRQYMFRRLFERFGENENAYTLLRRLYYKLRVK